MHFNKELILLVIKLFLNLKYSLKYKAIFFKVKYKLNLKYDKIFINGRKSFY